MNRYETLYREAAYMLKFGDPKDKPVALRIMLDTTKNLVGLLGISSLQDEIPNKPKLSEETRRMLTQLEGWIKSLCLNG